MAGDTRGNDRDQGGGGRRRRRGARLRLGGRKGESMERRISRTMSTVLRHKAHDLGMAISEDGYMLLADLLALPVLRDAGADEAMALRIVDQDDKGRFGLLRDDARGGLLIRANQGHTLTGLNPDALLTEVTDAADAPLAVHGTKLAAWEAIRATGLSPMGRTHVHFAAGLLGSSGVISGMRSTSQVLVFLDVGRFLASGGRLWRSENNVLLTGHVAPEFFSHVTNVRTGEVMVDNRAAGGGEGVAVAAGGAGGGVGGADVVPTSGEHGGGCDGGGGDGGAGATDGSGGAATDGGYSASGSDAVAGGVGGGAS
uniref:2'-phosphotransferase n=1 Tax=Bicosoecida sp. CB-2014 TaxID=1486930 RepID=A0A7S1CCL2_9STRA